MSKVTGGDPIPASELEKYLMAALQYGGLDKQNLAEIVGLLSKYNEKGLVPVKVFPIGIPNPDGVGVQYLLGREELAAFLGSVIETPRLQQFRVFPKGIPAIDVLLAELEIR